MSTFLLVGNMAAGMFNLFIASIEFENDRLLRMTTHIAFAAFNFTIASLLSL